MIELTKWKTRVIALAREIAYAKGRDLTLILQGRLQYAVEQMDEAEAAAWAAERKGRNEE